MKREYGKEDNDMELKVIITKLKKWFYTRTELIAKSLGPWFTVFATVVLCILLGIRIYTIYVDYVYVDGYSASQALSLITMRVMKALPYVMLTCFVLVITVFPVVHLLRKRKQSCKSESSSLESSTKKFGVADVKIKKKEFRNLFSADFKGKGGEKIDYCDRLVYVLENKEAKFSTTELMRLALALWESKGVVKEKGDFSNWVIKFSNALSIDPPGDMAPNKYRTGRNIAEEYNFSNFLKKT